MYKFQNLINIFYCLKKSLEGCSVRLNYMNSLQLIPCPSTPVPGVLRDFCDILYIRVRYISYIIWILYPIDGDVVEK